MIVNANSQHLNNVIIGSLILVFLLSSCRTLKPVKPPVIPDESAVKHLDYKSPRVLSNYLSQNEFHFDWITGKFNAEITTESNKQSFNVSLRAKKDSAIWISASLLGIEGARMLITQDSVRFMDKINNKFFVGDYRYLSSLLNLDIDFETIQSVLTGNSMSFYDEDDKLKASKDSIYYLLSTIKKRKLKKILKEQIESNSSKELVQRIWLNPLTFKINKIVLNDLLNKRTFTANYSNFQAVDSSYFPYKIEFLIEAQKQTSVELNYSKVVLDKPQSMPFNIPTKYERIR